MVKPLALTLGEPAGIGPDIAIAAWLKRSELKVPAFYLAGDRDFLSRPTAQPGRPDPSSADAAIGSIRHAVSDVIAGRAAAVVTNPIAKSVLYRAGFRHPGHTEFLAELAARHGRTPQPVMLMWSTALAAVPVTIHLSLRDAIAQLS